MKQTMRLACQVLVVLIIEMLCSPAWGQVSYSAEQMTTTIYTNKCDYPEFTQTCPPEQRFFRVQTYSDSIDLSDTDGEIGGNENSTAICNGCDGSSTFSGSVMYYTGSIFGEGSVSNNQWSVIETNLSGGTATTNVYFSGCDNDPFWWTPSNAPFDCYLGLFFDPYWSDWGAGTTDSSTNSDGTSMTSSTTLTADESGGYEGSQSQTYTLSDEFMTIDLLAPFDFDPSVGWSGGLPSAFTALDDSQYDVGLQGGLARFQFNVPDGCKFSVPYVVHYQLNQDTNFPSASIGQTDIYQTNVFQGIGTGTPQYYPSGEGFPLNPPYAKIPSSCDPLYIGGTATISLLDWMYLCDGPDDGCTAVSTKCKNCSGMPRWWVTEPYINLWAADCPVQYKTSLGETIGYNIYYKQRDTRPTTINGQPVKLIIAGWNNDWYSYVHFKFDVLTNSDGSFSRYSLSNWTATVYKPGGGLTTYAENSRQDPNTGDQLLPMDGVDQDIYAAGGGDYGTNGFRLVHADGSQDVYGFISQVYPTNYTAIIPIMEDISRLPGVLPLVDGVDGVDAVGSSLARAVSPADVGIFPSVGWPYTQLNPLTNDIATNANWGNLVMSGIMTNVPVEMTGPPSADAILSEHIDPYGHSTHFKYSGGGSSYLLTSVIDYDGNSTTLSYDTNGYLSSVNMPYGRTAYFHYNTNALVQLQSVTDANGMTSSFSYGADNYISSITTPYGTTSFLHLEVNTNSVAKWNDGVTRAIAISNPDGTHELYGFYNSATNSVPAVYPTNLIPAGISGVGTPTDTGTTNQGKWGTMYVRNSFYWGRAQCASLSDPFVFVSLTTNAMNNLSTNDYLLSHMSHWMMDQSGSSVIPAVSMTRDPSPDGTSPGLVSWYYYPSSSGWCLNSANWDPAAILRMLPDGSTWYQQLGFDNYDQLDFINTSMTDPYTGSVTIRSWNYDYSDGIDWSYTQVVGSLTNTWTADGPLVGHSWPGGGWYVDGSPDSLAVTTSETNADGSVTSQTVMYPHWYSQQIVAEDSSTTTLFYNDRSQISGAVTATGLVITNLYGSDGFPSASIAPQIQSTNSFTFTSGLLASHTDALGLNTTYTWDQLDRLTGIQYPDGSSISNVYTALDLTGHKDRLGHWAYANYNNMRQLTSVTDRNGNATSLGYCLCGGLDSVTDPLGNVTTYNRNLVGWINSAVYTGNGGNQTTRNFLRDSWGRVTNLTDSSGLNLSYILNMQGLATNISSVYGTVLAATFDAADRLLTLGNSDGIWVTNVYDNAERILSQANAAGTVNYGYTGPEQTSYTDALGHQTTYGYDAGGRLVSQTDANYNTNGFTYNPIGKMTGLADGNGHLTLWTFDSYGRKISKHDGNGVLVETNGYDANGRLTAQWTPVGGVTHYAYDNNDNLLSITYSTGTNITASYDGLNRLTGMNDVVGSSAFAYTNFGAFIGALASEDGPWASDTVSHTYVGQQESALALAQPSGSWTQSFGYDGLLRMTSLSSPAGNFGYSYNGAGQQITSLSMPGGNSIAQTFGNAGQLTSTILENGSTPLDSYSYTYNPNLDRTSVQRVDSSQVNYTYDNMRQLTGSVGTESSSLLRANENMGYTYDPAGNLSQRVNNTLEQSFTTDGANQLVNIQLDNNSLTVAGSLNSAPTNLTVNGQTAAIYGDLTYAVTNGVSLTNGLNTFTAIANGTMTNSTTVFLPTTVNLRYDANGNLVYDGLRAFGYDSANELTSVTVTNVFKSQYFYDGFGRRRIRRNYGYQRTSNTYLLTNEVHYVYDGFAVIQERSSNNVPLVTYTRGLDLSGTLQGAGGVGGLLARTDSSSTSFYHADGNGNVTALVNSSGILTGKYLYDPYGNILGMWGAMASVNSYRFSSKDLDFQTGLYYYGYRFYDPNLQRWPNQDPIGERGGLNLYRFVGNNPVNYVDWLGLAPGYGNPLSGPNGPVGPSAPTGANFPIPQGQLYPPNFTGPLGPWDTRIPNPSPNIPGGPWTWQPANANNPNAPKGTFLGPKQPTGPRTECKYVSSGSANNNQDPYWKVTDPNKSAAGGQNTQRYNMDGDAITPEEAHPGETPATPTAPPAVRAPTTEPIELKDPLMDGDPFIEIP